MRLYDTTNMKEYILSTFNQIDIFSAYLQIEHSEIEYCLENTSNKISNPLRLDSNPSLGFMWVNDKETGNAKIRMYDFANNSYRGDCFDLVANILRLNSNDKIQFITICKDIIHTLDNYKFNDSIGIKTTIPEKLTKKINLTYRNWNQLDISVWNNFGFYLPEIHNEIFPIQSAVIEGEIIYFHSHNDPCYAYVVGFYESITLYKLYFPLRNRESKVSRFLTNNRIYQLEAIHNLKPADILLITKSYKDKLQFKKILSQVKSSNSIEVTNISSESIVLKDTLVSGLNTLYPIIITNFDFDYQGLVTSSIHKRRYMFDRYMFTNGKYGTKNYGGKDLCEIVHNKGFMYAKNLIQQVINLY